MRRRDVGGSWAFRTVYIGASTEVVALSCDDHGFRVIHRRRCDQRS